MVYPFGLPGPASAAFDLAEGEVVPPEPTIEVDRKER